MQYRDVERALEHAVDSATPDGKRALALYAVGKLTLLDRFENAIATEFTRDAADAFLAACADPSGADADTLINWLDRIDKGILSDGDMDTCALWALISLEAWRDYQQNENSSSIYVLALTLLEVIDFEIDGADLHDFLADARMSEEFNMILRLLSAIPA